MTKQQTVELLQQQLPGFYSVEQVIKMINDIEETKINTTDKQISEFAEQIVSSITDMGLDLVDDYELSMSYREVELDSINFDGDRIKQTVEYELRELLSVDIDEA
jgi:hypothetical protein